LIVVIAPLASTETTPVVIRSRMVSIPPPAFTS
jgi:hypothetical protein